MTKIKEFFASRKPGFYVSFFGCVLALIGFIVYVARGGNYLSPVNGAAVTLWIIGIVCNVASLIVDFSLLGILPVALYAASFAVLLNSEMLFLTNVAFGVDGNSIDFGWIFFFICILVAILLVAVGFGMGTAKEKTAETEK